MVNKSSIYKILSMHSILLKGYHFCSWPSSVNSSVREHLQIFDILNAVIDSHKPFKWTN